LGKWVVWINKTLTDKAKIKMLRQGPRNSESWPAQDTTAISAETLS